jgi:hypothetical protein
LWCELKGAALVLRSEFLVRVTNNGSSARGRARLRAGARKVLWLTYGEQAPHVLAPLGEAARATLERSARGWRDWAASFCGSLTFPGQLLSNRYGSPSVSTPSEELSARVGALGP